MTRATNIIELIATDSPIVDRPTFNDFNSEYSSCVMDEIPIGTPVTVNEQKRIAYEVCDEVHSHCDENCPVYATNNNSAPDETNSGYGCDCFKDGTAMIEFVRSRMP